MIETDAFRSMLRPYRNLMLYMEPDGFSQSVLHKHKRACTKLGQACMY